MNYYRDFSGGPVVKSLRFHCMSCEFKPWSGRSYRQCGQKKKKKRIITKIFNTQGALLLVFWLMYLSPSQYQALQGQGT